MKSRTKRGSLCTRRMSSTTVTCHGLRVVEPVYHQALLRGRWRSRRSRARRGRPREARFVISQDHIDFVLFVVVFNPCDCGSRSTVVEAPGVGQAVCHRVFSGIWVVCLPFRGTEGWCSLSSQSSSPNSSRMQGSHLPYASVGLLRYQRHPHSS